MKNVHRPRLMETGSFSLISCRDLLVLEEAATQVEAREVAEHLPEPLGRRLVEAVQRLDLLDLLGVHTLPAPVCAGFAPDAAPGLRDVLLHRPSRYELRDHECHDEDTEQGRKHQQDAFGDVGCHVVLP